MSTHADDRYPAPARRSSATQHGLAMFAGILMVLGGVWHALSGIAALFRDQVYVTTPGYTFELDLTAWGWTHLLLGALVAGAGAGVLQGRTWGRVVGVGLAILSMFVNFLFLPHHPVWSILIIALDVAIIWALVSYGGNADRARPPPRG